MSKQLLLRPRMSEKAYAMSQQGTYVIDVPAAANRLTIKQAVEMQFEVTVTDIRITNMQGKAKRTIAQKGRVVRKGSTSNQKKAYVSLKAGDSLPFFASVEEAEEKQKETQEKMGKALEKQAAKDAKEAAKPARRGIRLSNRRSGSRGGDK